jgi:hypothetical protein
VTKPGCKKCGSYVGFAQDGYCGPTCRPRAKNCVGCKKKLPPNHNVGGFTSLCSACWADRGPDSQKTKETFETLTDTLDKMKDINLY